MLDVLNYVDYRLFLRDYYLERKSNNKTYSYQLMADRAGFKSKSFLKLVIDGKKNLSRESIKKLTTLLKLNGKHLSYFQDLVEYNQASSHEMREYLFKRLSEYRSENARKLIQKDCYDFYSQWYHNTIRELVTQVDFKEDYEWLSRQLIPKITANEAKRSVSLLLSLGFLKKSGKIYQQTDPIITTGDEVLSRAVKEFHEQNSRLIREAVEKFSKTQRDISCVVLGLSDKGFGEVKKEIQKFRKTLLDIASRDASQCAVYHVNCQLFPTTQKNGSTEK